MVNIELNIEWKKSGWQLNTNETFMDAAVVKFDRIVWIMRQSQAQLVDDRQRIKKIPNTIQSIHCTQNGEQKKTKEVIMTDLRWMNIG